MPKYTYKIQYDKNSESDYESDGGTRYTFSKKLGEGKYAQARCFTSTSGKEKAILSPLNNQYEDDEDESSSKNEVSAKANFFNTLYPLSGTQLIHSKNTYRLITDIVPGVLFNDLVINDSEQIITVTLSAVKALKDCHIKGIIICDLSGSNIHYDAQSNKSYLIDGGLSVKKGENICSDVFKTKTLKDVARSRRKYTHIAPECWAVTTVAATTMMDIYSFGDMILRLLKGRKYLPKIEEMLACCQDIDPAKRPTLDELESELEMMHATALIMEPFATTQFKKQLTSEEIEHDKITLLNAVKAQYQTALNLYAHHFPKVAQIHQRAKVRIEESALKRSRELISQSNDLMIRTAQSQLKSTDNNTADLSEGPEVKNTDEPIKTIEIDVIAQTISDALPTLNNRESLPHQQVTKQLSPDLPPPPNDDYNAKPELTKSPNQPIKVSHIGFFSAVIKSLNIFNSEANTPSP